MVVVYCELCGQRVPEEQLQAGSAVCFSDQRYYCKKCSSKLLELPRESPRSLSRTPKPGLLRAHTRALPRRRFDSNWFLIGGAACALLFAVIAFNGKSASTTSSLADSTAVLQPASVSAPTTPLVSQINLAPQSATALALTAAHAAPLDERERELLEMRQRRALSLLDEARSEYKASPGDPWSYRDRLLILTSSYRNTPAADEAARLLSSLKMPDGPRPPPVPPAATLPIAWSDEEDTGWRPLLDGRSPPFLGGTWGFWKYDDGTLIAGGSVSNQTDFSFVDGDVRIRFQVNDSPYVEFTVRQAVAPGYSVALDRRMLEPLWGRPLELVFSCRTDRVSATLNGHALNLIPGGRSRSGHIHICNAAGAIRIFSLDYRPPIAD